MLKRSTLVTSAAIVALGLVPVAQAGLKGDPAPQPSQQAREARSASTETQAPASPTRSLSLAANGEAGDRSQADRPSPRLITLPRAESAVPKDLIERKDLAARKDSAGPLDGARAEGTRPVSTEPPSTPPKPAAKDIPVATAGHRPGPVTRASNTERPASYRAAKWAGGEAATWKNGRDAYGFSGSFGGCRVRGFVGSGGYKLDRIC